MKEIIVGPGDPDAIFGVMLVGVVGRSGLQGLQPSLAAGVGIDGDELEEFRWMRFAQRRAGIVCGAGIAGVAGVAGIAAACVTHVEEEEEEEEEGEVRWIWGPFFMPLDPWLVESARR